MMFKLTRKLATQLAVPGMQPLTFAPPGVIKDTPEARAKMEREAKVILREMERYFGREKFKELVQEISKGGQGNTPDEERNALILSEWLKEPVNKAKFAREFCQNHPGEESPDAVRKQLDRLLDIREREAKEKAEREQEFQEALQYRGKSLLGDGTK